MAEVQNTPEEVSLLKARFENLGTRAQVLENGRRPFTLTCLSWQPQGREILFFANPRDLSWNFKLRGTLQRVKSGTISYIWGDNTRRLGSSKGTTFFDEPRLTMTFQTGNCMPVIQGENGTVRIPPGLIDLYEFLELMDEPMILDDGTTNYRVIAINTILFPSLIVYGFFAPDGDINFTESAEDPAHTSWSATFIIKKTSPPFMNAAALKVAFEQYSFGASTKTTSVNEFGSDARRRTTADVQDLETLGGDDSLEILNPEFGSTPTSGVTIDKRSDAADVSTGSSPEDLRRKGAEISRDLEIKKAAELSGIF